MGVDSLYPLIKEVEELNKYFPSYRESQYQKRDFMLTIVSMLLPEQTKKLIDEARKHRSIKGEGNQDELVEVDPEICKEIQSTLS